MAGEAAELDDVTKEHIANALWMSAYDENRIAAPIVDMINAPKNSSSALGAECALI